MLLPVDKKNHFLNLFDATCSNPHFLTWVPGPFQCLSTAHLGTTCGGKVWRRFVASESNLVSGF